MSHISCTTADAGKVHGTRLRLLSYNIQAGITTSRYHHYLTHSWKHVLPHAQRLDNLDRIARIVRDFDIVGLQEVDAGSLRSGFINQTEYLADRSELPFWFSQTNRRLGKLAQHSNGLLSRFRPSELTEHKLPGFIPGRGVLMARFGHGDDALVVIVAHLALGRRARLTQLAFIGDLVNAHRHAVLMGDLNCQSMSQEIDELLRRTQLCEPIHGLHTFPSWRPYRNIDHILVSPELAVEKVHVLDYAFSDHLPIAMDLRLPEGLRVA